MRILCEDSNRNISVITGLLRKIESSAEIREWTITDFQAIPTYSKDWSGVGGAVPDSPGQRLYEFTERIRDEHAVVLSHSEFTALLENAMSVCYADISFVASGQNNKITVFDGDIIELNGPVEKMIQ